MHASEQEAAKIPGLESRINFEANENKNLNEQIKRLHEKLMDAERKAAQVPELETKVNS